MSEPVMLPFHCPIADGLIAGSYELLCDGRLCAARLPLPKISTVQPSAIAGGHATMFAETSPARSLPRRPRPVTCQPR